MNGLGKKKACTVATGAFALGLIAGCGGAADEAAVPQFYEDGSLQLLEIELIDEEEVTETRWGDYRPGMPNPYGRTDPFAYGPSGRVQPRRIPPRRTLPPRGYPDYQGAPRPPFVNPQRPETFPQTPFRRDDYLGRGSELNRNYDLRDRNYDPFYDRLDPGYDRYAGRRGSAVPEGTPWRAVAGMMVRGRRMTIPYDTVVCVAFNYREARYQCPQSIEPFCIPLDDQGEVSVCAPTQWDIANADPSFRNERPPGGFYEDYLRRGDRQIPIDPNRFAGRDYGYQYDGRQAPRPIPQTPFGRGLQNDPNAQWGCENGTCGIDGRGVPNQNQQIPFGGLVQQDPFGQQQGGCPGGVCPLR